MEEFEGDVQSEGELSGNPWLISDADEKRNERSRVSLMRSGGETG